MPKSKAQPEKRGPGRPSKYNPTVAAEICKRLASGKTLRAICRDDDMPAHSTVLDWVRENQEFSDQYTRARETGYAVMADQLLEIADDSSGDVVEGGDGEPPVVNHEAIARARLRVDTRKWLLSKALPKAYGDKVTQEITGKDGAPVQVEQTQKLDLSELEPEERATLRALLLKAKGGE